VNSTTLEPSLDPTQRIFELTALYEVSRILIETPVEKQLTFEVLTAAMGLAGSSWGVIWIAAEDDGTLVAVNSCGRPMPVDDRCALSDEWWRHLAARSEPILWAGGAVGESSNGAAEYPQTSLPWLDALEPELVIPLTAQGRLYGIIGLGPNSLSQPYAAFLLNLLGSIGHLVAMALSRRSAAEVVAPEPFSGSLAAFRQKYPVLRNLVGESAAVLDLYQDLTRVAAAACTVLLQGETGTGKQLAAEVLHALSPRHDGPFIEVDCSAFPDTLIDSELFGHKKGAFTGAAQDRRGVFELADGGSLFLDEVGNLPPQTQGRLLRVLQERRFRPIGGERNIEVDVRVIAATNSDLRQDVKQGTFREDLFYRLYVYPLRLRPLRDRRDDIPVLAKHFLEMAARENNLPVPDLSEGFLKQLSDHPFPGNIRELRHLMERTLLRSEERELLEPSDLRDTATFDVSRFRDSAHTTDSDQIERLPAPEGKDAYPLKAGEDRGAWVLDNLRRHRFNVKATAEALALRARRDPDGAPPLTDRSSLTYYLQGECYRLFLENQGNVGEAGSALAAGAEELTAIATSRMRSCVDSARRIVVDCPDLEEARKRLGKRLSKLPAHYLDVLDQLAEQLWQEKKSGAPEP
jgi:transcriptional regulator with GAF, ATPase, and Fis domain